MFAGLAIFFSFAVLFTVAVKYSIAESFIVWLGTLVGVRYGLHAIFHRISVHRGIWHSLLAAIFCSIATAIVFARFLVRPDGVAWLAAGFMMIGYLTHLTLDEMYSVDVMDTRIKSSFGTALKLIDTRHWGASVAMAAACALAVMVSPPTKMFVDGVSSKDMWTSLHSRLLSMPGEVEVYPGHTSGSACGAGISGKPGSTLGYEKRWNPLLSMERATFIDAITKGIPPRPAEMDRWVAANLGTN